jgi:hypothetical protein
MRELKVKITGALFPLPKSLKISNADVGTQELFDQKPGLLNNVIAILAGETPVWHKSDGTIEFNEPGKFYLEAASCKKESNGTVVVQLLTGRATEHRNSKFHTNRTPKPELLKVVEELGVAGPNEAMEVLARDEMEGNRTNGLFCTAAAKVVKRVPKPGKTSCDYYTSRSWFKSQETPLFGVKESGLYKEVVNVNSMGPILCYRVDCEVSLMVSFELFNQIDSGVGFCLIGRGGIAQVINY